MRLRDTACNTMQHNYEAMKATYDKLMPTMDNLHAIKERAALHVASQKRLLKALFVIWHGVVCRARQTRLWASKHLWGLSQRVTLKGTWNQWREFFFAQRHLSESGRLHTDKKQLEEALTRATLSEERLRRELASARSANAELQKTIASMQAQLDTHEASVLGLADEYAAAARREQARWAEKVKRRDARAAQLRRQTGALWRAASALLAHIDVECTRDSLAAEAQPRLSLLHKGGVPSAGVLRRTWSMTGEEELVRGTVADLPVDLVLKRRVGCHTKSHEEIRVKNFGSHLRSAHALAVVADSIGVLRSHGVAIEDVLAIADNDVRAMTVCDLLCSVSLEHLPRSRDLVSESADCNARLVAALFLAAPTLPASPTQLRPWEELREAVAALRALASDGLAVGTQGDNWFGGGGGGGGVPTSPSAVAEEAASARAERFESQVEAMLRVYERESRELSSLKREWEALVARVRPPIPHRRARPLLARLPAAHKTS